MEIWKHVPISQRKDGLSVTVLADAVLVIAVPHDTAAYNYGCRKEKTFR